MRPITRARSFVFFAVAILLFAASVLPAAAVGLRNESPTLRLVSATKSCSGGNPVVNLSWTDSLSTPTAKYYVMTLVGSTLSSKKWTQGTEMGAAVRSTTVPATVGTRSYAIRGITNIRRDSNRVTLSITTCADTTPPTVPANLDAAPASCNQINVSWNPSTDSSGVQNYDVYRNGALWTTSTTTAVSDMGRAAATAYQYQVRARDMAGNLSSMSAADSATTPACADTAPPTVPTNVVATAVSCSQVNVSWNASTDPSGILSYDVYRGGTWIATTANLSIADTGRAASTAYSYTVRARDTAGNISAASGAGSATTPACADTTLPSVPTNVSASAVSCSQVNVSWTASSDASGIKNYDVYRNGALWTTTTATSISDTGRAASTAYSYTVRARDNANNVSAASSAGSATTPACPDVTLPSVPTNVSASAVSCSQVNVSWNASSDASGIKNYDVYRNGALWTTTTALSLSDTGRAASTAYSYTVRARDNFDNVSGQSSAGGATTPACPDVTLPSVPTSVSASAVSCSQVNVSWNASSDASGIKNYDVYRNGALWTTTVNLSIADTARAASTAYSYTVRARDNFDNVSGQSSAGGATTPACPDVTLPSVPTNVSASAISCSQVNVSWNASSDASGIKNYDVYRNGALWTTTTGTSLSDSGRSASTAYSYTVRARDNADNVSGQSSAGSATTPACPDTTLPSVPTSVIASAASCSQVNVSWNASSDASGIKNYDVYRNGALWTTTTATSISDTGRAASTAYSYTVRARDNADNVSAQSTAGGATTPACPAAGPWSRRIGSTDSDSSTSVATDASGNVYVAGYFRGSITIGTTSLTSAGGADIFLVKFDGTGNVAWAKRFGSTGDDVAEALHVNDGRLALGGRLNLSASLGGATLPVSGPTDLFVAEYQPADGAHVWSKTFGGTMDDSTSAVAVDGAGNMYATGYFRGTVNFGGTTLRVPFDSDLDVWLAKFDAQGNHVWSKNFTNDGNDRGYGLSLDATGQNVALSGSFSNSINFGGTTVVSPNAQTDAFVAKFTAAGTHVWSRDMGADQGSEAAYSTAFDASGNVYTVGYVVGATADFGGGVLPALGSSDGWVAKYAASNGAHLASRRFGGSGNDYANDIAVDSAGSVIVGGSFSQTADFGGTSLSVPGGSGSTDGYLARYNSSLALLSAKDLAADAPNAETLTAIAMIGTAPVAVGYFYSTVVMDGTTQTSAGMADGFVMRTTF